MITNLGNNPEKHETLQFTVPKNCWFAASVADDIKKESFGYSLVGCTVAPGFDFADFEMADREELLLSFPEYEEAIIRFTY